MAVATLLPIICDFQANAVWVFEECSRVVTLILRVKFGFGCSDSECDKLIRYRLDINE